MQQQAILIVAQSGRFLAQIAADAGYHPIWVADCFGDSETRAVTARWQFISELNDPDAVLNSVIALSQGQRCSLVCGGGVELFYDMLDQLPKHISLLGNQQHTIEAVQNPTRFFDGLDQLAIAYPATRSHPPQASSGWLSKSSRGLGGGHIQSNPIAAQNPETYYQRHIPGLSGSALFLANGSDSQLLSLNQQFSTNDADRPFLFSGLASPVDSIACYQDTLRDIVAALTNHFELYGLNSLDFVINEANEVLVLEVNPRPSAAAELLVHIPKLFDLHLAACQGILPTHPLPCRSKPMYLHYIFAAHDILIANGIAWPLHCHDIPAAGQFILKGEPICSAIVDSAGTFIQSRDRLEKDLHHLLMGA